MYTYIHSHIRYYDIRIYTSVQTINPYLNQSINQSSKQSGSILLLLSLSPLSYGYDYHSKLQCTIYIYILSNLFIFSIIEKNICIIHYI